MFKRNFSRLENIIFKSKFCQNGPGGVQKVEKSQSASEKFSWEHIFSSMVCIRLPKNHSGIDGCGGCTVDPPSPWPNSPNISLLICTILPPSSFFSNHLADSMPRLTAKSRLSVITWDDTTSKSLSVGLLSKIWLLKPWNRWTKQNSILNLNPI